MIALALRYTFAVAPSLVGVGFLGEPDVHLAEIGTMPVVFFDQSGRQLPSRPDVHRANLNDRP